jgi:hypothetical protein
LGVSSQRLREVDISIVAASKCDEIYGSDDVIDRQLHLCAGVLIHGGKGDCTVSTSSLHYIMTSALH